MKQELKTIIAPVDMNEPSLRAAHYAYSLGKRFNGKVILLHVISTPGFLNEFFASGDEIVRITDRTKEALGKVAREINRPDSYVDVETRVERGKPYRKILEVAKKMNARFIVLGENHYGAEEEQELGTTVFHVTLKSPVPVLTFKGNDLEFGRKIIVPLDLTRKTRKQVLSAISYGINYNAEIHLVSVLIGGIEMKDSLIAKKLEDTRKTVEENGVTCKVKLYERSEQLPYKRVLGYAKDLGGDMIMLMTHREGYTYDNYIGAFAHHIINESEVPVLSLTASAATNSEQFMKILVDPLNILKTNA